MTSTASDDPTKDPDDPEYGVELPAGLRLERPASGGVRVELRLTPVSRALWALPRLMLVGSVVCAVLEAWRHHVFVFFWLLGLPLLSWLRGPAQRSLSIGEDQLELEGAGQFGRSIELRRSQIEGIQIGRGGLYRLYQRALLIRLVGGGSALTLVGISAQQAEFVNSGLQRWLSGSE